MRLYDDVTCVIIELAYQRYQAAKGRILRKPSSPTFNWKSRVPDDMRYVRVTPFSVIDVIDFEEVYD